ncbi:Peroxidase [Mycena sanguinolenta]|uniref:Peroxidase n=1 Tax=Mycena sanguinolenta TaxID=230812 RepID=A0A8H7D2Q3_9AGAR|nr:Peroxidase [Mycena sanguinolenta]
MYSRYIPAALLSLANIRSVYGASTPEKRATCSGGQSVKNAACCAWFPVLEDILPNMFNNECGDDAHSALRLSFHDAIGFSPSGGGGGADGSIITFSDIELAYPPNDGLDDAVTTQSPFIAAHNVTAGDFIQFAAAVSLSLCPGAPRVGFMMGRPKATAPSPSPNGLVPEPFDTVDSILARMKDAGGFTPTDVVALLASHSVAGADTVDPTIPGTPFDSTPSLFDTQIFIEVQLRGTMFPGSNPGEGEVESAVAGEMRLQSDHLPAILRRLVLGNPLLETWPAPSQHSKGLSTRCPLLDTVQRISLTVPTLFPHRLPLPANAGPHLPAGQKQSDIEQACATSPFPTFTAQSGPATTVPAM